MSTEDLGLELVQALLNAPPPTVPSLLRNPSISAPLIATIIHSSNPATPSTQVIRPYLLALLFHLAATPNALDLPLLAAFAYSLQATNTTLFQQALAKAYHSTPSLPSLPVPPASDASNGSALSASTASPQVLEIRDLFPHLSAAFIARALAHPTINGNSEQLIAKLLDDDLPAGLDPAAVDEEVERVRSSGGIGGAQALPPAARHMPERRNIFDDVPLTSTGLITRGKAAPKPLTLNEDLKAAILARAEAPSSDEDDDDASEAGSAFLDSDGEATPNLHINDNAGEDLPTSTPSNITSGGEGDPQAALTRLLELAYLKDPKVFERSPEARKSKSREALRKETKMDDERLEGWRWELEHDPKMKKRLAKHEFSGNVVVEGPLPTQRKKPDAAKEGGTPNGGGQSGGDRGGRGRGAGGGRGRARGSGRGDGGRRQRGADRKSTRLA